MHDSRIRWWIYGALVSVVLFILWGYYTGRRAAREFVEKRSRVENLDAMKIDDAIPTEDAPQISAAGVGKTPQGTLKAYYVYKDRGSNENLRGIVAANSLSMVPAEDTQGMSLKAQIARGLAIDHSDIGPDAATVYYRTWFSRSTQARGGRPTIAKLVKEDDVWKVDVRETLRLTMGIRKGKTKYGFFDGTKDWWK